MAGGLAGCALVAGSASLPVTGDDRAMIEHAQSQVSSGIPLITARIDERKPELYLVGFDG
jgi:hypothetical protein